MSERTSQTLRKLAEGIAQRRRLGPLVRETPTDHEIALLAHADAWEQLEEEFSIDHAEMQRKLAQLEAKAERLEGRIQNARQRLGLGRTDLRLEEPLWLTWAIAELDAALSGANVAVIRPPFSFDVPTAGQDAASLGGGAERIEESEDRAWGIIANAADWNVPDDGTPCGNRAATWRQAAMAWRDARHGRMAIPVRDSPATAGDATGPGAQAA